MAPSAAAVASSLRNMVIGIPPLNRILLYNRTIGRDSPANPSGARVILAGRGGAASGMRPIGILPTGEARGIIAAEASARSTRRRHVREGNRQAALSCRPCRKPPATGNGQAGAKPLLRGEVDQRRRAEGSRGCGDP